MSVESLGVSVRGGVLQLFSYSYQGVLHDCLQSQWNLMVECSKNSLE